MRDVMKGKTDGMRDVIKGRARDGMERVGEGKSDIREDLEKDGWDGKGRVWTGRKDYVRTE